MLSILICPFASDDEPVREVFSIAVIRPVSFVTFNLSFKSVFSVISYLPSEPKPVCSISFDSSAFVVRYATLPLEILSEYEPWTFFARPFEVPVFIYPWG